jgi:hypothetical protein
MTKDIIEGNKLIAVFMDYEYIPSPIPVPQRGYAEKQFGWNRKMKWSPLYIKSMDHSEFPHKRYHLANTNSDLKFHSSWDWLMPVVQKICKLHRPSKEYFLMEELYQSCIDDSPIKVWKAVVKFIEWHNEQIAVAAKK